MYSKHMNLPLYERPEVIVQRLIHQVDKTIIGKKDAIELIMIAILANGHVLLEDVPGVGKTLLVKSISQVIDCSYRRIQFTPDLLPADVTGVSVYNLQSTQFEYRAGPLAANIVLADELNRASPRTQASMLEAMEERHVTVEGITRALPNPFLVLATQNPLEYEGTYSLPEAQLDRFLIKLSLGYPNEEHEIKMLGRPTTTRLAKELLRPVIVHEELIELQRLVSEVYVDDSIKRYIVQISAKTREHQDIRIGASPRASLALLCSAQARALVYGRGYVIPDDVKVMAPYVLGHRLLLEQSLTRFGVQGLELILDMIESIPIPASRSIKAT